MIFNSYVSLPEGEATIFLWFFYEKWWFSIVFVCLPEGTNKKTLPEGNRWDLPAMSAKLPPLRYLAGTAHGGLKKIKKAVCNTSACQKLIEKSIEILCFMVHSTVFIWVPMFMEWRISCNDTWWLIPLSKWVITPVISGLTLQKSHVNHWGYNPLTSRGMSHQGHIYSKCIYMYLYSINSQLRINPRVGQNPLVQVFTPK